MNKWTTKEIKILKDCYKKEMLLKEISKILNRTKASIRNKAYAEKISNNKYFTEEEKQYVIDNYKSYNLREITEYLGRSSYQNVCRLARQLGLERTGKKKENLKLRKAKYATEKERKSAISLSMKKWHKTHLHPKGMLGKHHSKEYRKELSRRIKRDWSNMSSENLYNRKIKQRKTKIKNGTLNPMLNSKNPYSRARGGKRKDLNNIYFRSSWEANVARYYNHKNIKWKFEPKQFIFENADDGIVSYTPDFYLPELDKWVEVKGWMDEKSRKKLDKFKTYYPLEYSKLELVAKTEYKEISKNKDKILNWENIRKPC